MSAVKLLHAVTIAGNQIAINKNHILGITAPDGEFWIMVTSISGDTIQLHPETDYTTLVEAWAAE